MMTQAIRKYERNGHVTRAAMPVTPPQVDCEETARQAFDNRAKLPHIDWTG